MNCHRVYIAGLMIALAVSAVQAEDKPAAPPAAGAIPSVITAELTPPAMPFQRRATLRLSAETPADAKITWPELPASLGDLAIESIPESSTEAGPGRISVVKNYRLDPIKPGQYRLPELAVSVVSGDKEEKTILPLVLLNARDLTEDEKASIGNFQESAKPVSLMQHPHYEWYVLAGLAAVGSIAALLWAFRRRKTPPAPAPKPAWEVALLRLKELQYKNLPVAGKTERFYVDLSAIIRYYLEDRFALRAPEQTTPEFLEAAASSGALDETQQAFLAEFLRHSDRVKFARLEPTVTEMEQQFSAAETFVRSTISTTNSTIEEAPA